MLLDFAAKEGLQLARTENESPMMSSSWAARGVECFTCHSKWQAQSVHALFLFSTNYIPVDE